MNKFLKIKLGLPKIIVLAIFWGIAGAIYTVVEYFNVKHFADGVNLNIDNEFNFWDNFFISILIASFGGLLMGSIEVFYLQKKFRQYSLGTAIIFKSLFYAFGLVFLIFIGTILYHSLLSGRAVFTDEVYDGFRNHIFSEMFWSQVIGWSVVIILSQFVLQVSDKFGKGVLIQMLFGKYHRPKIEKRIFMFLDLKSSTTIAEKLKHQKYFEMLNDLFNDAADPIIMNDGEIYQYVGDEITISWKPKNGKFSTNCIKCFFDIQNSINNSANKYNLKYGLIPQFKAGMHSGEVITGEVGGYKKEIVFSGDVLNTASRIQSECNRLNESLLISQELLDELSTSKNEFIYKKIDEIKLKGKETPTILYQIRMN